MNAMRLTERRSGAPKTRSSVRVSASLAHIRVDSTSIEESPFIARPRALDVPRGGESILSITDLVQYLRVRLAREEGQTMAEYGIVLAVITVGVIVALGVLSGAIQGALTAVSNRL
jgi:Flp pilus assembly pilin Flp